MRIVVALGGNALLRRGEPMTIEHQRANVAVACEHIAPLADGNDLVVAHGNGPQIGLLALEGAAYEAVPAYPLDVLGAETQGMIGYLIEQELGNRLPFERPLATLLTMIEVDRDDPAFADPTKPIGPIYDQTQAKALGEERGWTFRPDGEHFRRVVPSPVPKRIFEHRQIHWLLEHDTVVICAGGGGIPTTYDEGHRLVGIEAVIDKDAASCLLARDVGADVFVMATDADAAFLAYGTSEQQRIASAHPDELLRHHADQFAAGSMLPKVEAACDFARTTGNDAVIGALADIEQLVAGTAGTRISIDVDGVVVAPSTIQEETR
jgi:carbamate kinase